MNIYYWSPFLSKVATVKAVVNSAQGLKFFSKNRINTSIIDVSGEWINEKTKLYEKKLSIIKIYKKNYYKKLPRFGFLKSRLSYSIIFIKLSFIVLFLQDVFEQIEIILVISYGCVVIILIEFIFKYLFMIE